MGLLILLKMGLQAGLTLLLQTLRSDNLQTQLAGYSVVLLLVLIVLYLLFALYLIASTPVAVVGGVE